MGVKKGKNEKGKLREVSELSLLDIPDVDKLVEKRKWTKGQGTPRNVDRTRTAVVLVRMDTFLGAETSFLA